MNGESRPPEGEAATETLAKVSTRIVDRPADIPAQLRRRRAASRRLTALDDGRHDPYHLPDEDLSDGALIGWELAINHLLHADLCPILPPAVRRARREYTR